MDSFPRSKREGETRSEYLAAMLELVDRSCAREFPEEPPLPKPYLIGAASTTQPKPKPARTPSLIGAPSATEPKQGWGVKYRRTCGAADGAGENYEWKMLTLVYLRMLKAGNEFQLASNMEEAGLFDDIVLRYRKHSSEPWRVVYLQLKHKQQKKNIPKKEFLDLSGDFSLVKYCVSFAFLESSQVDSDRVVIIFTTASIMDKFVDKVASDPLLSTGGKVVSFKAGGDVYQELCEWADFKEALTELHGQIDGLGGEEVGRRIKDALKDVVYQKEGLMSQKNQLIKNPTLVKLNELLKKLEPVSDKTTYSSFLAKLHLYTNQAHESHLDAMIKEELAKVWICNSSPECDLMFNNLRDKVKIWWQKDNVYLTQESPLWLDIIKSHTETLSKSTVDLLTKCGAEFEKSSQQILHDKLNDVAICGGIFNLRTDSRTAASSLKVRQALAKLDNVLHVNLKALLEREIDVFSAWSTRWCRVLVVECDTDLEQKHAARINERILEVVGRKDENKLLVLIAPEKHVLNTLLYDNESYTRFNDNFLWSDLTEKTKKNIFATKIVINGLRSPLSLSELLVNDKGFVNKADLEVISQLIRGDVSCGNRLDEVGKSFVTRRLQESTDGVPFVVNSVTDIQRKVVLVVAEPGMGKSTLFTHLANSAKEADPTAWIVHIKLNDCAQFLKEIDSKHLSKNTAKNFLEQSALSPGNCLERLLFGALEHKLIIFLDGVDEVCPQYEQQVFMLLSSLIDMKFCQIWVASRPVFQAKLEVTLKVTTLRLIEFSKKDQKEFFKNVWMEKIPSATPEKCSEATEGLFHWLSDSLGKDNPILGVPLMAAMIAETYQEQMFAVNGLHTEMKGNNQLNVKKLYTTFVEKKFDLYCTEKKKTPGRELAAIRNDEDTLLKQMHRNHRLAALRALFSQEEIVGLQFEGKEKFDEDLTTFLNDVAEGREKIGIIDNVKDGIPHFVHRSFSEYYAASWLTKNYYANRKFVERILFDPAYKFLVEIFNRTLAENHPLHDAILNKDREATVNILNDQHATSDVGDLDAGGRTPLHLAVFLSGTDPQPDCIRIVECLIHEHKARLDVTDLVLGWVPLRYAELSGAWDAFHVILNKGESVAKGGVNLIQQLISDSKPPENLMLNAARDASALVVRYLVEDRSGSLDCRGPQGETMIHRAAEGGNVEMLEFLLSKGSPINITDNQNNTAFRYASPKAMQYLLDHGLGLEDVNNQGLTALQDAAQSGEYKKVAALLEVNASFQVSSSAEVTTNQLNACLLCAAFAGSLESVKALVERGGSVHSVDKNGHTAAWVAMHRGHVEVMDWLLLRGSEDGDTPLHGACRKGETEIVAFILSRGMDIDAKGWVEQTPLTAAAQAGHLDVVKLLLEEGATVDCRDVDGKTHLNCSALFGHEQVAALLLYHGANIHLKSNNGWAPLHTAASNKKIDVAKLLLENGANADCRDMEGWTPLMFASSKGHEPVASLLLLNGADINAGNNKGLTPLHASASSNSLTVVKLLLENEASFDCLDEDGFTPLHIACLKGHKYVAALLLLRGADVRQENNKGTTPLQTAAFNNMLDVVELLLENGAEVECRDEDGVTPLICTSSQGHEQVAALLLRHGALINAASNKGMTPLHAATLNNKLDVVQLLLKNEAHVDCRDDSGLTPLNCASSEGHEQVAALLLRHGADIEAGNHEGLTPLQTAVNNIESNVVEMLLENGAIVDCSDEKGWTPLITASWKGLEDLTGLLLRYGADVNARNKLGLTPLHAAASKNELKVMGLLLEKGAKVNCRDENGCTPIHNASLMGHDKVVALLLRHYADVHKPSNDGMTPLHVAAYHNKLDVVKLLLENGAEVDCLEENGDTPLIRASSEGHEQVSALLLRHGADVHRGNYKKMTSLHTSVSNNKLDVVTLLLEKGAKVNCLDVLGWTPLQNAASKGHEEVAALLLSHGADIHAENNEGCTPLFIAAHNNRLEFVKFLLEKGANVDSREQDGVTPLNRASSLGHEQVAALLLRHGADIDAGSNEGFTPLLCATYKNNLEVVKLLLGNEALVDCRHGNGDTPLRWACWKGHEQVASLLLRHGADIEARNNESWTPLYTAALNNRLDVVKLLLENGAFVDARHEDGGTPLHIVSSLGHEQVAALLLRHGADIHAVNKIHWTPLYAAASNNRVGVMELLLAIGAEVDCLVANDWTPLISASLCGHEEAASLLLRHGADIYGKSNTCWTPLHAAAWGDKLDVVKLLLEKGAEVDCRVENGDTPLISASSKGHEQVAALLLRHGADVHAENNEGRTPLSLATELGHSDVVKVLTAAGGEK